MGVLVWHDQFTGTRYTAGDQWNAAVRQHLITELRALNLDRYAPERMANNVARFWTRRYYAALFPLRFGFDLDATGLLVERTILPQAAMVDLEPLAGQRLRHGLLDRAGLPPILPDPQHGNDGWLLADRLLIEAALLNVLLRTTPGVSPEQLHTTRLAALVAPFFEELPSLAQGPHGPLLGALVATLLGRNADVPAPLQEIVLAVRERQFHNRTLRLVLVAAQRIKQYVFDTPGLNEIRGGSTLLDHITADLRARVEQQLGPELVLRAAGSTLMFLAPDDQYPWEADLRRAFYTRTGSAFPSATALSFDAQTLLNAYGPVVGQLYASLAAERAKAAQPAYTMLPFETRCALCGIRAAEGWDPDPGDKDQLPINHRPLCRVCRTKRETGQRERFQRARALLGVVGINRPDDLARLGVVAATSDNTLPIANELGELIPPGTRRRLLGVVYGDGNNFGAVAQSIPNLVLGVQWAARVYATTTAAAALAMAQATQQAALASSWTPGAASAPFTTIPFQPLALGGDDVSLFAWGPVALYFAAAFTGLTDRELAPTSESRLYDQPLGFALGVLVTDEKTPVRKSVDFTDEILLKKWAKRAAHDMPERGGRVALLLAQTAEGVPANLEHYRNQTYKLGASGFRLYTTLRPFSPEELRQLLGIAGRLVRRGDTGRLQRLAEALYNEQQGVLAGLLHYAYQRGRERHQRPDRRWIEALETELAAVVGSSRTGTHLFITLDRYPFGLKSEAGQPGVMQFSPLWDLVELTKMLS